MVAAPAVGAHTSAQALATSARPKCCRDGRYMRVEHRACRTGRTLNAVDHRYTVICGLMVLEN
jgi:hypothetical protein